MWSWCVPGTGMGLMWIFPLLFFVVMIGMIGAFWRRGLGRGCGMRGDHRYETPRQILDRRYAAGELTKEQYDEMRRNVA